MTQERFALLDLQLFQQLAPYVKVELYHPDGGAERPRRRLELYSYAPKALVDKALAVQVPCVRCGSSMAPFREREPGGRGAKGHVYIAVSCPLDVSVACSRGNAARQAYKDIETEVRDIVARLLRPQHGRSTLRLCMECAFDAVPHPLLGVETSGGCVACGNRKGRVRQYDLRDIVIGLIAAQRKMREKR